MKFTDANWAYSNVPQHINQIKLNQICDIADLARNDPDVIKLWIGEGDLATPDFIKQGAIDALAANKTRYTFSHGIPELREALSRYHKRHWNANIPINRISITAGGVQAVMQAFQAILEPGDEVIFPVPAWPNSLEIVKILNGKVVPVAFQTNNGVGFNLDLDDIFAAVTPKTRAIFINSPSNPTGWIMPLDDMKRLLDFARERGIWIISDEVYTHFTFDGVVAHSFLEIAQPTDRLFITNTFSKNWCMTGWRMGWIIFPEGLSEVFDNLSQYNTTSVSTFSQYAGVRALDEGDNFIKQVVERSKLARDCICSSLEKINSIKFTRPQSTFYLFFSVEGMPNSYDMAKEILTKAGVGLAPGSAFGPGGDAYLRACFGVDPLLIAQASERLQTFLRDYSA